MRVTLTCLAALALCSTSLSAQGRGNFTPPPDHWVALDSLATVLNLSASQKAAVAPHQAAIDSIVKVAVAEREKLREQFQSAGGPPSDADRQAMRTKFDELQTAADNHLNELKALLNDQQKAKLEELRPIQIAFRRRPGM